jgi:hypothetical protein
MQSRTCSLSAPTLAPPSFFGLRAASRRRQVHSRTLNGMLAKAERILFKRTTKPARRKMKTGLAAVYTQDATP